MNSISSDRKSTVIRVTDTIVTVVAKDHQAEGGRVGSGSW